MSEAVKVFSKRFKDAFCIAASISALLLSILLIVFYACGTITIGMQFLSLESFFVWFLDIAKITKDMAFDTAFVTLTKAALSIAYIVYFVIMVIKFIKTTVKVFSFIDKKNKKNIQSITDDIINSIEGMFITSCRLVLVSSLIYFSSVSKSLIVIYLVALPLFILLRVFQYFMTPDAPKNLSFLLSKSAESLIVFAILCIGYSIIVSPAFLNTFMGFGFLFALHEVEGVGFLVALRFIVHYLVKPILSIILFICYCKLLKLTIKEPEQHLRSKAILVRTLIWNLIGFGFSCIVDALYIYQQSSQSFETSEFIINWFSSQSTFFIPLCLLSILGIIATVFPPMLRTKKYRK